MSAISENAFARQRHSNVVRVDFPRLEPDPPGGWFVVVGDHGWLYGSRREALAASRDFADEVRQ
ncbi:hypothetical protein [Bradyrhizobium sp. SZCCHNR1045]|uniref:hypothetical protein n=1 Tax=Bradyrhizobium sp. SZCCHNR1045 TaxID=3057353 RepID=UPI002915E0F1|nr:hypothetical protein [Bradyrhizobium sp. SZCCHNR1045]